MVKFLITRPIATIMTFVAILVLGIIASRLLPVSLMPDIDIPEITVQINRQGESVREIENGIVAPLRYQLMQLPHLDDIKSESRDGRAILRLRFEYGADINYSFIDVNEKVDAAMRNLPPDMERPAIIKASASDLPVFYINIWKKGADDAEFMELSNLTRSVIIKRLEQLSEVAMVDITGHLEPELYIEPDESLLKSLGFTHRDITYALEQNNLSLGSLQVADGQYLFNIRFSNALRSVEDVRDIRIRAGSRFIKLHEIANIGLRSRQQDGLFLKGTESALSLAVIKQSDARMGDLKESVQDMLNRFEKDYPEVEFQIIQDQTTLLDHSINDLKTNLLFGGILAFIILFFFLKDARSPWLIGISIPLGLIISMLFLFMAGMSINIISLSGLILGVGMMIDNSIIVIDNITQYIERGESLANACIKGTNEVITPLISSILTTCAVFIPLIFLSGISGAIFFDQAMAVAIGLTSSFIVSITLTPVLYHVLSAKAAKRGTLRKGKLTLALQKLNLFKTEDTYERGFKWVFTHRKTFLAGCLFLLVPGFFLALYLPKERFPLFNHNDILVSIDWNERINLNENLKRLEYVYSEVSDLFEIGTAYVGTQKYLMHKEIDQSVSESLLYFNCSDKQAIEKLLAKISDIIKSNWDKAIFEYNVPETIFEKLFHQEDAPLIARISDNRAQGVPELYRMNNITQHLNSIYPYSDVTFPPSETYIEINAVPEMLTLYEVSHSALYERLRAALNAWQVGVLHTGSQYIPMVIGNLPVPVNKLLDELMVANRHNLEIPVKALVDTRIQEDYKILWGSEQGAFVPVNINSLPKGNVQTLMANISMDLKNNFDVNTSFGGRWFSSRELMGELAIVLLISLALLYFILAAQFESLRQPLILLLEIPINITASLFMLWIFGNSINIMAMIGIIVMSGVVVNDSILKIDTVNRLRRGGMPLLEAIEVGGRRRLKPIIMTSITTILALTPILWGSGMGSDLQKPLALTVIGGMILGTILSLYFIPLCYYYLCRNLKS